MKRLEEEAQSLLALAESKRQEAAFHESKANEETYVANQKRGEFLILKSQYELESYLANASTEQDQKCFHEQLANAKQQEMARMEQEWHGHEDQANKETQIANDLRAEASQFEIRSHELLKHAGDLAKLAQAQERQARELEDSKTKGKERVRSDRGH